MKRKVGFIHTMPGLVPLFNDLCKELMPEVEIFHMADEQLLKDVVAAGGLDDDMVRRAANLALCAEQYGAEVIMLTCSSYGPTTALAKDKLKKPFLRIDEAMADEAVRLGKKIGLLASATSTVKPTSDIIKDRARLKGKHIELDTVVIPEALKALQSGDAETHDRLVLEKLREMMQRVDVIVLAQASLSRAAAKLPEAERKVPFVSSPRLGVQRLKEFVDKLPKK